MKTEYLIGIEYYTLNWINNTRLYMTQEIPCDDPEDFIERFNSNEGFRTLLSQKHFLGPVTKVKYIVRITKEYLDVGEQPSFGN